MAKKTRFGLEGYGVRRAGLFSNKSLITGTLDVTDAPDVVAFSGDVSILATMAISDLPDSVSMSGSSINVGWVAAVKQAEIWTPRTIQAETWTPN